METDGTLSVLPYAELSPVTPELMSIAAPDNGLPVSVIAEGRVMSDNLRLLGRDEKWLRAQARKRGCDDLRDVYLMTVDGSGKIYFAKREGAR